MDFLYPQFFFSDPISDKNLDKMMSRPDPSRQTVKKSPHLFGSEQFDNLIQYTGHVPRHPGPPAEVRY